MSKIPKTRAVWVEHKPTGRSVAILCPNVRGVIARQVKTAILHMGVPKSECTVKIGAKRI